MKHFHTSKHFIKSHILYRTVSIFNLLLSNKNQAVIITGENDFLQVYGEGSICF